MEEILKQQIEDLIKSKKVFLFMKGTPEMPACGFSQRVAHILQSIDADFGSFDILTSEEVRQGIKEYANWPTIPQLYVDGKFIGGCDIVEQLFHSEELKRILTS